MMTYTRSAIGLLTRQYRSVLKKCFLINMGLFALGAVSAHAAAPTPTLDDLSTKVGAYMSSHATYDLTTTQGTNTHFLLLDNGSGTLTRYWYTPNESTQEKNNVLLYLLGNLTTEGASSANYVFKQGSTYYTFDTTKLPTSTYTYTGETVDTFAFKSSDDIVTFTNGDSGTYDVAVRLNDDTTKYYNIAINLKKAGHVGSRLSDINWSTDTPSGYTWKSYYITGSTVTVSGDTVLGAIRLKAPHNGKASTSFNQGVTYTYDSRYGTDSFVKDNPYTVAASVAGTSSAYNLPTDSRSANVITNDVDTVIATGSASITNKTYANNVLTGSINYNYNIVGGSSILNQGTIGDVIADFLGNITTIPSASSGDNGKIALGAVANLSITNSKIANINSITGDFIANSASTKGGIVYYGGAISNSALADETSATIGDITGDFMGNSTASETLFSRGGAISNYTKNSTAIATISSIMGDFIGNSTYSYSAPYDVTAIDASGGAISNYADIGTATIGNIIGSFVRNYSETSSTSTYTYGGAISNTAISGAAHINSIEGDFVGNSAYAGYYSYGGAISNYAKNSGAGATIGSIIGDFIGNYSSTGGSQHSYGGAISNYADNGMVNIGSIEGDFVGNSSLFSYTTKKNSYGGAISNYANNSSATATITSITGDFVGNYNSGAGIWGGAISNYAASGKANIGSITGDFVGNYTYLSNTANPYAYGSAISNYTQGSGASAKIGSIVGNFVGNYAYGQLSSYPYSYGAISNYATYGTASISSIIGDFIGNHSSASDTYVSLGGAISNYAQTSGATATITNIKSNFTGNSAVAQNYSFGGAIYNYSNAGTANIGSIEGNFVGNSSIATSLNSLGGAISNVSKATIGNIKGEFVSNYAKTSSTTYKAYGGAIFNGQGSYSSAPTYSANSVITLDDTIFTNNYVDNNNVITPNSIYNAGIINIKNGATVTVNDGYDGLSYAQLKVGTTTNSGSVFNLSVDNGVLQTDKLGTVTNNGAINWDLDVDLLGSNNTTSPGTPTSDNITATINGTYSIIINAINLMTDKEGVTEVTFASGSPIGAYILSPTINDHIYSPGELSYKVTYNKNTGVLTFTNVIPDTLVTIITKTDETDKAYEIATGGEIVNANLGTLVNNLKVTGNGEATTNKVIGGNFAGVTLGATAQTLELEDIAEWSGFTGNAINNGTSGTVKVKNVNFSGNSSDTEADIANAGTLEFTGTNSLEKITGNGTMEVKSGTTTVASLAQGTLTVTSGELVNNGAATIGGGSNAGTISGTGSLATSGAFENKSGATISQAVSHSGTGTNVFTNNGTISGAVTNSGVFANNSSISSSVNNSGSFTNTGTITGDVTNIGTMTSAAEKMTGTVANNGTGVLNLSGSLAKNISGTGTTNVDSALALNSGAGIAGTLAMDTSDTVTVSSGAITSHNIGEIKGTGNIALDINYGETITADAITVATDTQASTLKITTLNETGTRAANFEKQILFGTNGNTKLDVSGLTGWNGSTDKEAEVALETNTIAYNANYGTHKWTETTALTVIGSAEGLYDTLKYTTTISNDRFDPKAENLTVINQYSGTGSDDRVINFAGIQEAAGGTYTMKASTSLGTTAAGKMTLDGEKNTTTKALTVVNLNGNAGYNLTNATEIVLDEVKLTGASGNVITASNDSAKVTLNDAFIDGNIVKTGSNKMTVETSGNTTLNGNTSNVNLSNSGTLTNNGTVTGNVTNTGTLNNTGTVSGDVTNNGTLNSGIADITGTITNNSTFNLSGDLSKNIGGAGTTVLQSTTSTVAADRTISGTLNTNGKTIGMQDEAYETLTVGNLTGNANITINAKASTEDSDKISISSGTSNASALTISALNLDTTGLTEGVDYTKTMSVVADKTTGVSVAFASGVDTPYNQTGVAISDLLGTDSVTDKEVAWDETFGDWKQSRKKDTSLTISGTDMVYTETNYTVGPKVFTSYAEGLKELNQFASTDTKTFNAADSGTTHTIIEDLGNTVGKVSIDGKGGTLDFDDHKGFVMASGTEVSLKDVTAKNADGLADVKNGATLNLENVTLEGNGVLQNAGTINLNGSNSIDSIIAGTATTATLNVNADWDMDTTVTGHTVNVNGTKLSVGAGKLIASDSLNAKDGSEIEIGSNKVNLDQVKFESGSKLNLKVNSLSDFGAIEANNITIATSGAELSATLAQGIVKIGQEETLQLLKADNSNFNNFADSFDNEMYHFEKADNNGAYNISQVKTAEEVVEEAGGSATEARAAAAWVDGDQFEEGSTAAKVADALADLAQNNPQEFNNSLATIAPVDAPETQSAAANLTDKLLVTVGKYLSNQDIGGLTSGDALQDVTIWAKGYYGKSKLSNHGKIRGFDSTNKGVIAGLDKKLNKSVKLGGGFQYDDNDVDGYRRDIDVNTLTGFVYGEYRPSNWFVSGVASYGKSDYDEEKSALGIRIKDKHSAEIYSLQALTGYDFKYVTPEIGARYYRIKRHGYEDNIGQSVSGKDLDLFRGVFGLRTSYEFGMFKPEVYAGITYDFVSDKDNAIVSLPNGSSYMVDGKRLNRFGTEFSANVTAQVTDNTKIGAGYEGKFREHYQDHTGMISVKYEF